MDSQDSHELEFTTRQMSSSSKNMCQRIQAQKARGHPVLNMRQDTVGENKCLEKRLQSEDWKPQVKMEYIAADTLQQKALVGLNFTYLSAKARAPIHAAGVPRERRRDFFPRVIMTITNLD
jgi:hypothetical protein